MKDSTLRVAVFCILQVFLLVGTDADPGSPANMTTVANQGHDGWIAHKSGAVCGAGWNLYEPSLTCFQSFQSATLVQQSALDYCSTSNSYLAPVTPEELDYISGIIPTDDPQQGKRVTWWLGYEMRRTVQANSSVWELVDLSGRGGDLSWMGLSASLGEEEEESKLCVVLVLPENSETPEKSWKLELRSCQDKSGFLCAQDSEPVCIDRKGNEIWEGERYVPPGHDACYFCRCMDGKPGMCLTTMCAKPHCELYRPDPEECCQYICTDGGNGGNNADMDVSDNMRWVLTMLTSFILLGMMLFMVYRMRQKRIAYLRYRAQQMREGNMMDFEPGTGPPPVPNLDDIEGAVYREPPPPYSFLKDEHHIPTEQPPPYISTVTLPMDVNRNRDRRSLFQQDSDAVALLDGSVSSEPNTPTLMTGVPAILPSPPAYTSSTENSTVSTPQTEQSTPGGETATNSTAAPQTILPSINTFV